MPPEKDACEMAIEATVFYAKVVRPQGRGQGRRRTIVPKVSIEKVSCPAPRRDTTSSPARLTTSVRQMPLPAMHACPTGSLA